MKHTKRDSTLKACRLPPPPPGELKGLDKGQNSSFWGYGHVAYQIKEDSACFQHGSKC